jgi:tRNA threonylcarbamoyladenosine biosynthesis protein TsaB
MRVLALDTTSREGSVALVENDRVLIEQGGDPSRSHAERLPIAILRALHEGEWNAADVDAFAVVAGPGSFTGLRIGIATIQGLAFVSRRPVVAISALEALAQSAAARLDAGDAIGAWVDAHRGEVYGALYRVADAQAFSPERLSPLDDPVVSAPRALLARWHAIADVHAFIGDGADAYADLAESSGRRLTAPPLAGAAGLMAAVRAQRGEAVDPSRIAPIYIRRPDAVLARERAQSTR